MNNKSKAAKVLEFLEPNRPTREKFEKDFVSEIEVRRKRLNELLLALQRTSRSR